MNVERKLTTVTAWLTAITMMVPSHAVVGKVIQGTVGLVILWVSKSSTSFELKSFLSQVSGKGRYPEENWYESREREGPNTVKLLLFFFKVILAFYNLSLVI